MDRIGVRLCRCRRGTAEFLAELCTRARASVVLGKKPRDPVGAIGKGTLELKMIMRCFHV